MLPCRSIHSTARRLLRPQRGCCAIPIYARVCARAGCCKPRVFPGSAIRARRLPYSIACIGKSESYRVIKMQTYPKISVITSSYNQGDFIGRTLDSVLAQNYPNLEHIVVDGMSNDQTPEILAKYDHLRVIREPDSGQADAINKGFRAATGDILCFLNSDDTFLPGALRRVAQ